MDKTRRVIELLYTFEEGHQELIGDFIEEHGLTSILLIAYDEVKNYFDDFEDYYIELNESDNKYGQKLCLSIMTQQDEFSLKEHKEEFDECWYSELPPYIQKIFTVEVRTLPEARQEPYQ